VQASGRGAPAVPPGAVGVLSPTGGAAGELGRWRPGAAPARAGVPGDDGAIRRQG
jgi:hypothetical protein